MRDIERLKEEILKEYPRLTKESSFTFACHPGVPCFNACCGDVNIFLTPYDIVRLKKNLGISSEEFLSAYTVIPFDKNIKYPAILLKMNDDQKKSCPFLGKDGCRVYDDRPWSCRMYPLGLASPKEDSAVLDKEFYFLLEEGICKGFKEKRTQTVAQWLDEQGIIEYDRMGAYFKELTLHSTFQTGKDLSPEKIEMFFLACYNLDKFRDFLFDSTFFDKFDVDGNAREKLKTDDVELLRFGHKWLMFSLCGEKTMRIKKEVLDARQKDLPRK